MKNLFWLLSFFIPLFAACTPAGKDGNEGDHGSGAPGRRVISLEKNELSIATGKTATLSVVFSRDEYKGKPLIWESSDESVAIVAEGKVVGVAPGNCLITVRCEDVSDVCRLTVFIPVTNLAFPTHKAIISLGDSIPLKDDLTIEPEIATERLVWETSDAEIATVKYGIVTAAGPGVAKITVSTSECSESFEVVVVPVTQHLSLNEYTVAVLTGEVYTLQMSITLEDISPADVKCVSSDEAVVTVENLGNGGVKIRGIGKGIATVTCSSVTASVQCIVHVQELPDPSIAVDLGLTGIRVDEQGRPITYKIFWAVNNIGASSPEEYGDYYAWGVTERYYQAGLGQKDDPNWSEGYRTGFSWQSYKWSDDDGLKFSKYCHYAGTQRWEGKEKPDGKVFLDPEDDVAAQNWDVDVRIPTRDEWVLLLGSCKRTFAEKNGVKGLELTGGGNSIFLPYSGYRKDTRIDDLNYEGHYWSSERLDTKSSDTKFARAITLGPSATWMNDAVARHYGLSIRPVME